MCSTPEFNFGEAQAGSEIAHAFTLFNAGDEPLIIDEAKPSCGCTVAALTKKELAPGEDVQVEVTLDVGKSRGSTRKLVTVISNDPLTAKLELVLTGMVVSPVRLTPERLYFGSVKPGQSLSKTVNLTTESPVSLKLLAAFIEEEKAPGAAANGRSAAEEAAGPRWTAEHEVVESGSHLRVTVTFHAPDAGPQGTATPRGSMKADLVLRTDHETYRELRVPLSAVVAAEISFAPQEIVLRADQTNPVTRYLIVTAAAPADAEKDAAGAPFQIAEVRFPAASVKTQVQPLGRSGYRVQLSNLTPERGLDGEVVIITTDHPSVPELHVPIRVIPATDVAQAKAKP